MNNHPSWLAWPEVSQFALVPYGSLFKYLGTTLSAAGPAPPEHNFPFNGHLIENVLKLRPIMTKLISGRILQIKALIASKFVYRFQLLPLPDSKWFVNMERFMFGSKVDTELLKIK